MDAGPSCFSSEALPPPQDPKTPVSSPPKDKDKCKDEGTKRDFLNHLESYLAKRDGVDKLLKISRYASKFIIASSSSVLPFQVHPRLKSFESSVGLSRKAFRLGKFVQDVNALRTAAAASSSSSSNLLLSVLAYGGEGSYYFVEQFVWLTRTGLIDPKHSPILQKISAWTELVGYVGSISLKLMNLRKMDGDMKILMSEVAGRDQDSKARFLRKLAEKRLLRKLSIVQDLADGLMAFADLRGGKSGPLSDPFLLSCAGLLSALISTHKNWISC